MSLDKQHMEWLSLIEISGPFLAVPVLKEVFPQGLEKLDANKHKRLRQTYDEWREAWETKDPQSSLIHRAWIEEVLFRGLELNEDEKSDVLKSGKNLPKNLTIIMPEHAVTLVPDYAVVNVKQSDKPLLLIQVYDEKTSLTNPVKGDRWIASPAERMVQMCRMTGCRMGLVTNGERWMLVDAPVGATTTFASWYSRLWSQEPTTLQAFVSLLGIRRFFLDDAQQLPALLDKSLQYQDEVTEALGEQVRRAVEVLIQALDRADLDRNRELLRDVAPTELYEAGLTVMMRLVFLLCAEERGLLLLGDERYETNYAISTLRDQLRKESDEILERRWDAWSRLLSVFRAVYGGIEHEDLRMPALGGSLFDPDRFPFLEGRDKGSNWLSVSAKPLPIDNRTVLLLLEAIQVFQGRTLSYRALDVEQIGYVYEGLLERTVKRTEEVTLELKAGKKANKPWVTLGELESAKLDGGGRLAELLKERTGSSDSRIHNDLVRIVEDDQAERLLTACNGDRRLRDCIKPYFHLLRTDPWGYPLAYPKGSFIVAMGSDRRETGTHYTPKSLTEVIVKETLEPLAYIGPAQGKARKDWEIKPSGALLDLKICDMAMGSGAFLVQVCRWLSERLVESWLREEKGGKFISVDGDIFSEIGFKELLPPSNEERLIIASRLIAEKCLYGVDMNPLAVELAKLSIWLITLAKDKPFEFLDHNLRHGDSLLGIQNIDQLASLTMEPSKEMTSKLFSQKIDSAIGNAIDLRKQIRGHHIRDIHDIKEMQSLDLKAREQIKLLEIIADALVGRVFKINTKNIDMTALSIEAGDALNGKEDSVEYLKKSAKEDLNIDLPERWTQRKPFHWPLEFPEIFEKREGGFDAVVGNPPFLGGTRISEILGDAYNSYLSRVFHTGRKVDLCGFFFRRAFSMLNERGLFGLLATNTISQGTTRKASLSVILQEGGSIIAAHPAFDWPGRAAVVTANVILTKAPWQGRRMLKDRSVVIINDLLDEDDNAEAICPVQLDENEELCFTGSSILGMGFFLDPQTARSYIEHDSKNSKVVKPVMGGEDLNNALTPEFDRWIIDFYEMDYAEASSHALPFQHLEKYVRPERIKKDPKKYPRLVETWWKFWHSRQKLYEGIQRKNLTHVLARARVSDHHMIDFLPANIVFSEQLIVFLLSDWASFSVLQSSLHDLWSRRYASTMKSDVRYIPTDCFETFPFPPLSKDLERIGEKYFSQRKKIKSGQSLGLTKIYNSFHDVKQHNEDIKELRSMFVEMDLCVLRAYGWEDISLNHDFYTTDRGVRFTISDQAKRELVGRLIVLNNSLKGGGADSERPSPIKKYKDLNRTAQATLFDVAEIPDLPPNASKIGRGE